MRNNVYFHPGGDVKVYVQCAECGEYVARYIISGYTSERRYESFLRSLRLDCHSTSRRTRRAFKALSGDFDREYEHVLDLIKKNEDQHPIEEIIEEEFDRGMDD